MTRWDAARVASRRQLPKPRKMMGPVGAVPPPNGELRAAWDVDGNAFAIACKACGHDVCSCKPVEVKPTCMYCGAVQEDLGPMKTRMVCEQCSIATKLTRPGSVDVAGLEKLRAERFTEYHLRKAAEREQNAPTGSLFGIEASPDAASIWKPIEPPTMDELFKAARRMLMARDREF